jgi:PAS domain S-box-containing protein
MLARTFQDITYHDDLEIDLENVNKILQGKLSTFSMEKRYIRRDRSLVWVNLTVAFVREPAGESGYFISVIEDISGRKRAEMALQQSERDLAKAQQIAHMGNWEWDVVRDTITRSEETRRIFGVDDDSVMTKDYKLAIWHPDDLQRALEIGQRMISEPTECDLRIVRPNGEIRYIHQITELVRDASGKVVRVFGINQDITQRKLAEDALRQSEAKYRALVEASPDAILVTTLDGKMINVNSQTAKMHGYESVEEMQLGAENGLELMSPPDRLRALEMIPKIMSEGAARLEGLLLRRDGSSFPGEWNTAFFLGESGAPVLIHVVRDITERKRAEERLLRYAKRLESLHEIDRAILAALSPEEIAEAALTHLQELLRCQWASVALYDYVAGQATLLAVKITEGDSLQISSKIEKGAQLPLKQITTLDALRQGRPLIREDVDAVTDLSFPGRLLASQGLRSYMVMPLVVRAELMGCLILGSSYPRTFDAETLQIAQEVASSQAIALQQARLYQQLQADRQQLEKLSMRLLEVQEAERRHIARELHDQIGQMLTGLKLILQVGANSPLETAKEENLRKAQSLLDELIADVREMSLDLRPAMLDDLGLLPTLLWHFERYTAHTGIKVEFTHRRMQGKRFRAELETVAYRVVQEALTNVARHAQIGQVRVSLWVEQDILNVQIRDQGVGFDLHKANGEQNTGGLAGMQERVNLLGGKLVVKSASGSGVTMTARLPLK